MLITPTKRLLTKARAFSTIADLEIDNLVIGAGVVGLAVGEKLTRSRPSESTFVVEKNKRIGEETSARNSEVIHAGLYYPEDSLKTKLCIQGNRKLYELFKQVDIPYKRIGKWVVSQDKNQDEYLKTLHEKSNRLGVETYFLDSEKAKEQEPEINAYSVLVSPSTGIIDSHGFMDYLDQSISKVGDIALNTSVQSIRPSSDGGYLVEMVTPSDSNNITTVFTRRIFNCGGLYSDKISNMLIPDKYKLHYAKGNYYSLGTTNVKVNHLIYPCPEKNLAGLGTHLTVDLAGRIKFGPDVEYIDNPNDYSVTDNEEKKDLFVNAIQSYLPGLNRDKLHPDYSGIRPKLAGPGKPFQDFIIKQEDEYKNFFSLIGIESPGLTSSLAIADYVYDLIEK